MAREWGTRATEIGAVNAGNGQKMTRILERREGAQGRGRCGAGAAARRKEPREVQLERIYARPRVALRTTTVVPDNEWQGHTLHVAVVTGEEWIVAHQREVLFFL